ncbi:uncharacterized protein LOC110990593, partial [Acanthaster planci]|uniref:Uncharacterized protein LOC110990593 n=1 Tax=Acanthaster planci TaxID=133434 RepID=A0A8B8A329_ACAPL
MDAVTMSHSTAPASSVPSTSSNASCTKGENTSTPFRPTGKRSQNFEITVLMKLDTIIENQKEELSLLRRLVSSGDASASNYPYEEPLTEPMDTIDDMEQTKEKLQDSSFRKQMLRYLGAVGGTSCGDIVRHMMRKMGTFRLWSFYSLRGRKGKRSFKSHPLCMIVV